MLYPKPSVICGRQPSRLLFGFFLPQTNALLFIVLFTQNAYFIAVGNIIIFNSYRHEFLIAVTQSATELCI